MSQAISIVVGILCLMKAVMGFMGKRPPFNGSEQYTPESLEKSARMEAIPSLIGAIAFFVAFYMNTIAKSESFLPGIVCIIILLVVLIVNMNIGKKVMKKK